jgi:hypothetical protein
MAAQWLLMTCIAAAGQAPQPHGSIGGVVLNATRGGTPVPQADVALRIRAGGQLALLRETKSDAEGRFFFPHLPVGRDFRYLPGATRDGVHYPGPAIVLTTQHSHAIVELTVNDAVAGPCPLIIRRQRVSLYPEPGLLRVEESLLIDNPSASCYVGVTTSDNAAPVTLRLGIPADFSTITFNDDFFGRRFSLVGGKLVTGIPWTPGSRELKFTYVLRNSQRSSAWERSLDLPCEDLRVEVHTETPDEIGCSLPKSVTKAAGIVSFQSAAAALPAGQPIRVQLGRLPVPWTDYARWLSPLVLLGLVAMAGYFMLKRPNGGRRGTREAGRVDGDTSLSAVNGVVCPTKQAQDCPTPSHRSDKAA